MHSHAVHGAVHPLGRWIVFWTAQMCFDFFTGKKKSKLKKIAERIRAIQNSIQRPRGAQQHNPSPESEN